MSNIDTPVVSQCSKFVDIELRCARLELSAQDAYDLHQAIGSILPELVQPFKPWPREEKP